MDGDPAPAAALEGILPGAFKDPGLDGLCVNARRPVQDPTDPASGVTIARRFRATDCAVWSVLPDRHGSRGM